MTTSLMSIKQVASFLGVTERTIHRYMNAEYMRQRGLPTLKAFQLGSRWRFEEADVRAFLDTLKAQQKG